MNVIHESNDLIILTFLTLKLLCNNYYYVYLYMYHYTISYYYTTYIYIYLYQRYVLLLYIYVYNPITTIIPTPRNIRMLNPWHMQIPF